MHVDRTVPSTISFNKNVPNIQYCILHTCSALRRTYILYLRTALNITDIWNVRKRFKGNIMHILRTGHQKEAEEGGGGGDGLQHRHQQQGQPTAQGYYQ